MCLSRKLSQATFTLSLCLDRLEEFSTKGNHFHTVVSCVFPLSPAKGEGRYQPQSLVNALHVVCSNNVWWTTKYLPR